VAIAFTDGAAHVGESEVAGVECGFNRILELRIPLAPLGVAAGGGVRFQFSLWQAGLPMDALPPEGWLELKSTDPNQW